MPLGLLTSEDNRKTFATDSSESKPVIQLAISIHQFTRFAQPLTTTERYINCSKNHQLLWIKTSTFFHYPRITKSFPSPENDTPANLDIPRSSTDEMGLRYKNDGPQGTVPAADSPALPLSDNPTLASAMTSLWAHPRRTEPTGPSLPRRSLRREDAQMPLPEDFTHVAGRPPVALHVESQGAQDSESTLTRIGTSRGVFDPQTIISSRTPRGAFRRPYTTRSRTHLDVAEPEVTVPDDDSRTNQRHNRDFPHHRYRERLLLSNTRPSQRPQGSSYSSLNFQGHQIGETQGRKRSASPSHHVSRRTRHRSMTSNNDTIVVEPQAACTLAARRSHPYALQPKEAETTVHTEPPPPYFSIPSGSSNGVLVNAKLGDQPAPTVHVVPVPTAPQADTSRPPPAYSPRDPYLHPTASDYDVTRGRNRYDGDNNDAPSLPLYTPLACGDERVLQFGGSEEEQRDAFVRLLQRGDNIERYVLGEESGQQREEDMLEVPLPNIQQEEDQDMDMDMDMEEDVMMPGIGRPRDSHS